MQPATGNNGTFLPVFTAFRYYYVCLLFRTLVWDKNGTTYRGFADIAAALEKLVLLIWTSGETLGQRLLNGYERRANFFGPRFNLDFAILRTTVDVVHDIRHLGRSVRINGIKVVSRSFSRGKQPLKAANASDRNRACLFSQNEQTISAL